MNRMGRAATLAFFVLAGWTLSSPAQTTSGTISGTVKDSSGAVLPGAAVVIGNEETGISRTVQADAAGRYSAPLLSLGQYKVTASLQGFQTSARSGIVLTVGREAMVNFELAVGAVTQTVEVTGEAPLVDTVKGSMGQLVEGATISELPLNGRDLAQLITLQTGAVQYTAGRQEGGKLLVVSGARPTANVFVMDGVPIESFTQKTPTGNSGSFLGVDAVREFRVETNAFSAEYGRGSGGVFNIATKSGTNTLHGTAFEFHRNDNLDAARWEDNKFGVEKQEFKRNQYGFSLGGPIQKDKTFFFGTYEAYRERLGQSRVTPTFSDRLRQGFVPNPQTGVEQEVEIQPRVKPYLALYPRPNGAVHADGTGDFVESFSEPLDEHFFQVRVDHQLTSNMPVFARYTFLNSENPSVGTLQFSTTEHSVRNQYLTLEANQILTSTLLNTVRFGFTRTRPLDLPNQKPVDPSLYFIPPIGRLGNLQVTGIGTIGDGTGVDLRAVTSYQYADDARYTRGRNSLKFGFNWIRNQLTGCQTAREAGEYQFGSVVDFFNARVSRFRGTLHSGFDDACRSMFHNIIGLYAQDDLQVKPRFTLNLGLRYEFITVPVEKHGRVGNFRGDLAFIHRATMDDVTLGNPWIENPSLKNFAPRLGFAWDLFGDGRTAVRGGLGLFYQQFSTSWIRTTLYRMPPFLVETEATRNVPFPNLYQICGTQSPFAATDPLCSGRPAADVVPHKMRTPYVIQYNLNLQRQLTPTMVLTAGYAGSRGVALVGYTDVNIPAGENINGRLVFTASSVPNPNFNVVRYRYPGTDSFYNSFQLSVNKKFARGLQFQGSYTFSKTMDDISGNQAATDSQATSGQLPYYYDHTLKRALSAFDARNVFTFSSTYELPVGPGRALGGDLSGPAKALLAGWQLGGIVTLSDGFPGQITISNRLNSIGVQDIFPDLAPGASNNPTRPGNTDQYFDPAAFLFPPARTLGNLGRNTVILPGRATLDFTLSKNTYLREGWNLQFRFEGFNFFNRPNFGIPSRNVFNNQGVRQSTAGRIASTSTTARQIQLGLKLVF